MGVHDAMVEAPFGVSAHREQELRQEGLIEADVVAHQRDAGLLAVVAVDEFIQRSQCFCRRERRFVVLHQINAIHFHAAAREDIGLVPDEDFCAVENAGGIPHHEPQT